MEILNLIMMILGYVTVLIGLLALIGILIIKMRMNRDYCNHLDPEREPDEPIERYTE